MKLILWGATGYIGGEILQQCIKHNYIHHVLVLTRRPLDERFSHPKVTQILHENFEQYPTELLDRLRDEGAEACIWALGGPAQKFKNLDDARNVDISYPIQAAEALAKHVAPALKPWEGYPDKKQPPGAKNFPFRMVFISGWGAEQNQFRKLWMYADSRKIKGAAEKGLFEVAENSDEVSGMKCFEVIALRPGGVLAGGDGFQTLISEAVVPSIGVDRLAKCAINVALDGSKGKKILENKDCLGDDWASVNSFTV